jgi:hypothetical protein
MEKVRNITLISDDSTIGRARKKSLRAIFCEHLALWPLQGITFDEVVQFSNTQEFWLAPEGRHAGAMQFDPRGKRVLLRFHSDEAWDWFLRHHYPQAATLFTGSINLLPFGERVEDEAGLARSFSLSWLHAFFHDLSNRAIEASEPDRLIVCWKGSRWMANLNEVVLKPFEFFAVQANWTRWDDLPGAAFRTTLGKLFAHVIPEATIMQASVFRFFHAVCRYYMLCASDEEHRTELLTRILQEKTQTRIDRE